MFGTEGTGKMVLTDELRERLAATPDAPTLVYLGARTEPALVRDLQDGDGWPTGEAPNASLIWMPTDHASDFVCAEGRQPFDATLYCSPVLSIQGHWPAVDPLHSRGAVALDAAHVDVAARARDLLAQTRRHVVDTRLLELLSCRAHSAARDYLRDTLEARVAGLPEDVRGVVQRGRRLEAYLTTPFESAMPVAHGEYRVDLRMTLRDVAAILDGSCDDTEPEALRFIGALPD